MFSLAPWNEVFLPRPEKTFTWNWNSVLRQGKDTNFDLVLKMFYEFYKKKRLLKDLQK